MDSDGYPTEEELEKIRSWRDDWNGLMLYLKKRWRWDSYIWRETIEGNLITNKFLWHVSTGGWSGHEEMIQALQENYLFWGLCWLSSRRGGHYEFEVKGI